MDAYDWSTFRLRVPIRTAPDQVQAAWTSGAGLESWFLREATFTGEAGVARQPSETIRTGDSYTWRWHGWPDEVVENGTVLKVEDDVLLAFSFGKAGNVTVRLLQEAGHLVVELVQDRIPEDPSSQITYHLGCMKGWLFYLVNLKSILEAGPDLRNRDVRLTDVINS